jgi:hypothetical protein
VSQFHRAGESRVFRRPFHPEDSGPTSAPSGSTRFLKRILPESWRFARQMSDDLLGQTEFLPWPDRADVFDTYFVRQAEVMLRADGVLALVEGGEPGGEPAPDVRAAIPRFAHWARALTTSVLMELNEPVAVREPEQALTYLFSRDLMHTRAAARWSGWHGLQAIAETLERLPGYALVILASSPSDTAERFIARDAFWTAVHRAQR